MLCCGTGRAAVNRYLLPTGPTAANPQHTVAVSEWDRQTDGQTGTVPFHRRCSAYDVAVPVKGSTLQPLAVCQ